VKELRYLPFAVLRAEEVAEAPQAVDESRGFFPAPYVDWSRFAGWDEFQGHYLKRRASLLRDSRQKRRHLENDLGRLSFVAHDTRPEVFDQCIAWKSAQYIRTGLQDMFRRPESVRLFRSLEAKGVLLVSSLSAGSHLLAVHFGAISDGRFYSWIAAYDPRHGHYSPGRLLLEDLLRERQARGDREFDFGIGNSSYKWHYATHNRTIGPLGSPAAAQVLGCRARASVKRVLRRWPGLLARVQRLRLRMRERGVRLRRAGNPAVPAARVRQGGE
jgi:CelD/BcsL family acetyltransferase involved in cellulose biosynthesis